MQAYTIDVIALVALTVGAVGLGWYVRHVDRVLRDPDHPDHELAKDAVASDPLDNHRFP